MNQRIFILLLSCLIQANLIGCENQQKITVSTSYNIDLIKMKFKVVAGLIEKNVEPVITKNSLVITIPNNSEGVILRILYPKSRNSLWTKDFLINNSNVLIDFTSVDKEGNPINLCVVKNAIEFDKLEGYIEFQRYLKPEYQKWNTIENDTTIARDLKDKLEQNLSTNILRKKLDFVFEHSNLILSFFVFRDQILPGFDLLESDSLKKVFEKFPDKIKYSAMGQEALNHLNDRISIQQLGFAPDFESLDIQNKVISLSKFHGKFVLLDFWASWCQPCIEKIHMLKELRQQYPNQLQIISITYDKDTMAFTRAVEKYEMNWIHIFHDSKLIKTYGNTPIPALYLVDKDGKLIFNSFQRPVEELPSFINNLIH